MVILSGNTKNRLLRVMLLSGNSSKINSSFECDGGEPKDTVNVK
jgi:hypothetical protein